MVRIDVDGTDGGTTIDVVPLGQCRPDPSLLSPDEQARLAAEQLLTEFRLTAERPWLDHHPVDRKVVQ